MKHSGYTDRACPACGDLDGCHNAINKYPTITPTQMAGIEHCRTHGGRLFKHSNGLWRIRPLGQLDSFRDWDFSVSTRTVQALIRCALLRPAKFPPQFEWPNTQVVELT